MNPSRDVYDDGYVAFEGSKILQAGPMAEYTPAVGECVVDGGGGILMPGMINTHTHLGMIPFRSLMDDCKDRLRRFLIPMEEKYMNEELAVASSQYAVCELLLGGVTTFFDMYYHERAIAKALEPMGIRGILAESVMEADLTRQAADVRSHDWQTVEDYICQWKDHPRISPAIAPHGTTTCTLETLKQCRQLSDKYQVLMTMHTAEMDYEMKYFADQYQTTPIQYLYINDILGERMVASHCIQLNVEDICCLKKSGTSVAHCIGSNTKAAKGIAPVTAMLEHHIPVGLGTDGPASGNTLDIITQFKLCANFHKNVNRDRSAFPARDIIAMGTIMAAKALNMEDRIGSIEVGKQADLVLIETESVNMFPVHDPYSAIVYSSNASNVHTVYVAGECLVREKKLVSLDLAKMRRNVLKAMENVAFSVEEQL